MLTSAKPTESLFMFNILKVKRRRTRVQEAWEAIHREMALRETHVRV
jgi:hypothetical protein